MSPPQKDRKIIIIIDETGDPKKGKATDYVARQYLGRLGKIDNGIVAVVSYGLVDGLTFPLMFEIYQPKERLKLKDSYRSKPQIVSQMIREIKAMGFEIDYVLADSLYGESTSTFIRCLQGLNLQFAVAIRSNHGVRLPADQRVRTNKWRKARADICRWEPRSPLYSRNYLGKKESIALLGNHNGYRDHSRKFNLVCDDTNSGTLN